MAQPLSREKHAEILELLAAGKTFRQVAREAGVSFGAVHDYAKRELPGEDEREPRPELPPSSAKPYRPFQIDTEGTWLGLFDSHIPGHDRPAIESAVREAKKHKVVGVLLGGDILDYHELSDFDKDGRAARYRDEIRLGRDFLSWLRKEFPKARLVYKEGNHEERLTRYKRGRAPALEGLKGVSTPEFLELSRFGGEWVGGKRVVKVGKWLNVLHGHEYGKGGTNSPASPARSLCLKAKAVAMCGHHHRTDHYRDRDIEQRPLSAWTVGCLCHLNPEWKPLNGWNHGFALVELHKDGNFVCHNKTVLDGEVV